MEATICPGCGGHKSPRWDLCRECNRIYGKDRDDWPEWLHWLVSDNNRWEYAEARDAAHEVPWQEVTPADPPPEGLVADEPLRTRPAREMTLAVDDGVLDLLPYAPYGDPELDRQYREANGIPER